LRLKLMIVSLYGCKNCGLVFNANFDSPKMDYSSAYNNVQELSNYFRRYLIMIAKNLYNKYNLENKIVVEVGCGKGFFLKLLKDQGTKKISGFDPSYVNSDPKIDRLIIKDFFNKKTIKKKVDFIICRHVLEHIKNPSFFATSLAESLKRKGVMYFELPSLEWILKNKSFFDFFYEHCNYFSKNSVQQLFHQIGFGNIIFKYGLGGQYFRLEIKRGNKENKTSFIKNIDLDEIPKMIDGEIKKYKKIIKSINKFVIWGAGAKGVTFLNRLAINRSKCKYVIDINPDKQNKFVPITGQKVISPEILQKIKIDSIIVMNSVYKKEIKEMALRYNYKGDFVLL